ncbi:MAG: biopolymer transporter ExbD [Planctomycetota bacterium]
MRRRAPIRLPRRSPEVRVELTPLIDVVFLLLTFFVFAIVLMVRVDALDVRLPELTGAADAPRGLLVTVSVDRDGNVAVNSEPTDLESVAAAARGAIDEAAATSEDGTEPRLVLAIDTDAPAGTLIAVGGELARNGLGGFSLVGTPARGTPARGTPARGTPAQGPRANGQAPGSAQPAGTSSSAGATAPSPAPNTSTP